jgi:hypothetical protein
MKKYLLSALFFCLCNFLFAQGIRVNVYGSYVFDDHFEVYEDTYNYYEGTIEGGFQWGAGLEFSKGPLQSFELLYYNLDTQVPASWQSGQLNSVNSEDLTLGLDYILLAGNRLMLRANGKIETYGGLLAGIALINIENTSTDNSAALTKFGWGLRLGCNIWASETVGVKLQAQLLSAVQAAGGSAYIGTSGTGVGVSAYSTIYQFSLGGGLTFKMGKRNEVNKG